VDRFFPVLARWRVTITYLIQLLVAAEMWANLSQLARLVSSLCLLSSPAAGLSSSSTTFDSAKHHTDRYGFQQGAQQQQGERVLQSSIFRSDLDLFDIEQRRMNSVPEQNVELQQLELDCVLNGNGFFGDPSSITDSSVIRVEYLYQVTFSQGTTDATIQQVLTPILDRSITEGILPSFFDCPDGSNRRHRDRHLLRKVKSAVRDDRRVLQGSNTGYLAMSSQDVDSPLLGSCKLLLRAFLRLFNTSLLITSIFLCSLFCHQWNVKDPTGR
jgi:hypothetical protein